MRASKSNDGPAVAILMGVYNGARFIRAQLDTIAEQNWPNIVLYVSDDRSRDDSMLVVENWARECRHVKVNIMTGPSSGFAENFRFLLTNSGTDAEFVAFADQDDLWDEDKISAAVEFLSGVPGDTPALYCSRTRTVDQSGLETGRSPLFTRLPCFRNAIVQSIAGGNTMVMNRAAFLLISEASRRTTFVSHDWWCYLIVSGAGGVVHYSAEPRIGYRQHEDNLVGANNSSRARMNRIRSLLFDDRFSRWNSENLAGLAACRDLLNDDARSVIESFQRARGGGGPVARLSSLLRAGIHRQTKAGQLGLVAACALGRL